MVAMVAAAMVAVVIQQVTRAAGRSTEATDGPARVIRRGMARRRVAGRLSPRICRGHDCSGSCDGTFVTCTRASKRPIKDCDGRLDRLRYGDWQEIDDQVRACGHTNLTRKRGDRRCHAPASASVPRLRDG